MDMDYAADLAARIRLAQARGASVTDISRGTGVDRTYISRFLHERNTPSSLVTATAVADWCDKFCKQNAIQDDLKESVDR